MKLESSGVAIERNRTDVIAQGQTLRPLRDYLIVKPMDEDESKTLSVVRLNRKTLRGVVVAAGPGLYPWKYNPSRSKRWESRAFRKTEVKRGDVVSFGGREIEGYSFPKILYKGETHFIAREEDVTGIEQKGVN